MTPILKDRVLAYIADNPRIEGRVLRNKFRHVDSRVWRLCLLELRKSGAIQLCGKSRYRVPYRDAQERTLGPESIAEQLVESDFITPPSKYRLMAGR